MVMEFDHSPDGVIKARKYFASKRSALVRFYQGKPLDGRVSAAN